VNWDKKKLLLSLPYKVIALFITSILIITVLQIFNWDVPISISTYYGSVLVGMFFGVFLGIPFSYIIEGVLYLFKIKEKRLYNILHIFLHTIAGSFLPVIGNMYAFYTAILYLLLLEKKYKTFASIILISVCSTIAVLLV
jgi:hypothetical protein